VNEDQDETGDASELDDLGAVLEALDSLDSGVEDADKTQAISRGDGADPPSTEATPSPEADDTPSPEEDPLPLGEKQTAPLDVDSETVAISKCAVPTSTAASEVAAAEAAEAAEEAASEATRARETAQAKVDGVLEAQEAAAAAIERAQGQHREAIAIARDAFDKAIAAKQHADAALKELLDGEGTSGERLDTLQAEERSARERVASLRAEVEAAKEEAKQRLAEQAAVQSRSKSAEQEAESKAKAAEKVRALVSEKERAAKEASRVAKRAENDARVAAAAVAEMMSELEELKDKERRAAQGVARAAATVMENEEAVEAAEADAEATKEDVSAAERDAAEARKLLDEKRQGMASGDLSPEEIAEIAAAIGTLAGEAKAKQQAISSARARVEEAQGSIQAARETLEASQKTARKQQTEAERAASAREEANAKLDELKAALTAARERADTQHDAADVAREEARKAAEDLLTEVSREGAEAVAKAEEAASAWRSAARQHDAARSRCESLVRKLREAEAHLESVASERESVVDARDGFDQRKDELEASVRSCAERAWRAETRLGRLEEDLERYTAAWRAALHGADEAPEPMIGEAAPETARAVSRPRKQDAPPESEFDFDFEEELDTMRFDRDKLVADGLSGVEGGGEDTSSSFWLTVSTAEGLQSKHEFDAEVICLGRDPSCQVHLDNMLVSRRHAEIRRLGDFFALVDLGTSNGTLLNGSKVTELTILNNGDGIGIGKFRIRFEADFASAFGVPGSSPGDDDESEIQTIAGMTLRMTPETEQRMLQETAGHSVGCVVIRDRMGREARSPVSETFLIGKSPNCDLRLRGWFVPRKAAMIVRGLKHYKVENLSDSPSSILVNGKPVTTRMALNDGDEIEVYGQTVGFSLPT